MASILQLDGDSDSENDSDFVPDNVSDDELGSEAAGPSAKRIKVEVSSEDTRDAEKKARDAAWASFQASLTAPTTSGSKQQSTEVKNIKIEKKYRFAGEDVIKVVEVPEDSDEARAWLAAQAAHTPDPPAPASTPKLDETIPALAGKPISAAIFPFASEQTSRARPSVAGPSNSAALPSKEAAQKAKTKPKAKGGLSALVNAKPKKLTTLEKSRMDWTSHVSSSNEMKDELEAHRKGGGYIEKMEFLERVEDRLEDTLDQAKGSKRKR